MIASVTSSQLGAILFEFGQPFVRQMPMLIMGWTDAALCFSSVHCIFAKPST